MKYLITITIIFIFGMSMYLIFSRDRNIYYEKGLMDGSLYTLEYKYLPSMYTREKMHDLIDYNWPRWHKDLRRFWDSVEGKPSSFGGDSNFHFDNDSIYTSNHKQ